MPTSDTKGSTPKFARPNIELPSSPSPGTRNEKDNDSGLPPPSRQDSRLKRPITSKRTGGPRTSEGRARSSLNAIKHGGYVTAKSAALEFQDTLDELVDRINPIGAVEVGIVNSLAVELFRLATLSKLEVERVQSAVLSEVSTLELGQSLDYPWLSTHPDELRNPPALEVLRARLRGYFFAQLGSLRSQCGTKPSESDLRTIEALSNAVEDMTSNSHTAPDDLAHMDEGAGHEPAYLDELDRHMRMLAFGNDLIGKGMALPADLQPLVDYWLLRNYHRLEATRRELQVAQMVMLLTNDNVRRARSHSMRQLDDCLRLLELLRSKPLELGSRRPTRLGE